MTSDSKSSVARGYDRIAETYLERFGRSRVRDRWLGELIATTASGARILDLGCGAGIPVARELVAQGRQVTGVDGSARQIELARRNVPEAEFIQADMTSAEFAPASFDAVCAFYSMTHVPIDEHAQLFRRIAKWLRPDGLFVASLGAGKWSGGTEQWLGTEMFFGEHDAAADIDLIAEAGFSVERSELVDQDNEDARFLWIVARRLAVAA